MKKGLIVAGALVVVTAALGFFFGGEREVVRVPAERPTSAVSSGSSVKDKTAFDIWVLGGGSYIASAPPVEIRGIPYPTSEAMGLLDDRPYSLQGECAIRVRDVLVMEQKLKEVLAAHQGVIEQIEIVGSLRGREGFAILSVPTARFDGFVAAVRALGRMEFERISATALKPGSGEPVPVMSAVTFRFSDIDSSAAFDEGKGVLASSFGRGASHVLKGLAIIVEGAGIVVPLATGALLLIGPVYVIARYRRRREAKVKAVIARAG